MASANLIHRFESERRAQLEATNAKLEAQGSKFNLLQWMNGLGFVTLGVLTIILSAL